MHRLSFFAASVLVFGATHALAECNNVGCVRSTEAVEKLTKMAERTLSVLAVIPPANVLSLYDTGHYATEPVARPLPRSCGNAGCATPELEAARADNHGQANIPASTLITDAFAAVAERSTPLPLGATWVDWAERWAGSAGRDKSSTIPNGHQRMASYQ